MVSIIKEIFHYVRCPIYSIQNKKSFKKNCIEIFFIYVSLIVLTLISVLIIIIFNTLGIVEPLQRIYNDNVSTSNNLTLYFLIVCLFGAIYEEYAFRLYLRFVPIYIATSISLLIYLLLAVILEFEIYSLNVSIIYVVVLFFFLFISFSVTRVKGLIQTVWIKYFKYIFYFSILMFALLHLRNFELTTRHIFFIPIIILPQLISGTIFGFTRMKYGIAWCISPPESRTEL